MTWSRVYAVFEKICASLLQAIPLLVMLYVLVPSIPWFEFKATGDRIVSLNSELAIRPHG